MSKSHVLMLAGAIALGVTAAPALAQSPPMSPEAFVAAAAQSDQYEIQAGRLMAVQSQDARVKGFAQMMIDDHTKTSLALEDAAKASNLKPPPKTLGTDQQGMLSALQSMKGADLDRAYVTQQVNAHTAALVTQQAYAAQGSDTNLRKVAQSAAPIIQHHLEMVQQMKASMPRAMP